MTSMTHVTVGYIRNGSTGHINVLFDETLPAELVRTLHSAVSPVMEAHGFDITHANLVERCEVSLD